MQQPTSAFDAALGVCWALGVVVALASLSAASPRAPGFVSSVLTLLVVLQFFYVYQAARVALVTDNRV